MRIKDLAGKGAVDCLVIALTVLLLTCLSVPTAASQPAGAWSTPVQISNDELVDGELYEDKVYEYGWYTLEVGENYGTSWGSPLPFGGRMDVDDFGLHRVNLSQTGDLEYSRSTDNGTTWSAPELVMTSSGVDGCYDIEAVQGVLIVYGRTTSAEMAVSRSVDGGASWGPEVIADTSVYMTDPVRNDMVYADGKVYIAYSNDTGLPWPDTDTIVIVESQDLGQTWGDRRELSSGRDPQIAAYGNSLYMAYWGQIGSEWGLSFIKSQDGDAWSSGILLVRPTQITDPSAFHSLAVIDGRVFVAYMLYNKVGVDDYYWVHMNYSDDDGVTWEDLGDVTGGDGGELLPFLMLTPTTLHLTWIDNMGSGDWTGVTFYRSFTFDQPIPEFGTVLLPVIAFAALLVAGRLTRKR